MSKMKLVFTAYEERWDNFTVDVVIKATLNGVELDATSLPMSHKRATTEVVNRAAMSQIQDIVEQSIKRLGMQPSDYDRNLTDMLKQFEVFLHQDFRDQCSEYEIPFKHLLAA
ncbi:hypothetical protein OBP_194 [Pseudomonas phage OBP]|uniref:hypothetical protein n=1 Tax=Pseudomonas phage OBP TaxID=1124849 RepID=UPI000240D5A2|nr:hypothetical protein OBP_194 [Pseudomonas phage OBP]AEV89631.1 hypothetical protein OBP_194 [Pseudomonas phage OBP]